jgi:3-oxoacyl-[acyl-carrier protein] reductase
MQLKDKRVLVTGGGSGFGAGIVAACVAAGARVLVVDVNEAAAQGVAAEHGASAMRADVSSRADWAALAAHMQAEFGGCDVLVNNAGVTHLPQPMANVDEDEFDRIIAVNAKSVYHSARHIVPLMLAAGRGAVVNIASTAGISPRPNLTWYNASKGWMITATQSMAVELAPRGVRVNAICPVAGETPLLQSFMGSDTPEIRAKFLSTIPIGRFSTPQDIAAATVFLASDAASMITGVALPVDGGRCI